MTMRSNLSIAKMTNLLIRPIGVLSTILLTVVGMGQSVMMSEADYAAAKLSGTLPAGARPDVAPPAEGIHPEQRGGGDERGGGNDCACWIEPDASYTLAMQPNDDGSSPQIALPFNFDLYGESYNSIYINNNGNVSFVQAFGTFSSTGFPNANNKMVAPFWADVDTRAAGGGQVWYKVTPNALYVNWVAVGYFSNMTDKLNWFQLIITDGTDAVIGVDKNVSFCYKDMQWTTGSASGGTNGFGGTPSTVGANRGNGVDFIQFTRNDHAGSDYDGPFDNADGVSWLDFKNFVFTTSTSTQNIPPIAAGLYLCDTLRACVGQQADLEVTFLSPENGQVTTATSTSTTLSNWVEVSNISGIAASVAGQFTPTTGDLGTHLVTFTGTDDGTPNLTTTIQIVIEVIPPPSDPPTISGPNIFCTGTPITLTADGAFANYVWSNGQTGQTITVSTPGDYTVTAGTGLCQLASMPFTVFEIVPPPLEISGDAVYCGEPLPLISASPGYEEYTWSDQQTGISIQVGAGTYTVTGLYQGCNSLSAPFTVTLVDPGPPIVSGPLQFCEAGSTILSIDGSPYDFFFWSTGDTDPSITVTESGPIQVSANYLNCSYTTDVEVEEVILPPVTVTGDSLYCGVGLVTLQATLGFDGYVWNNSSVGQTINVQAGTFFVSASIGPCTTFSNTFTVAQAPAPVPVITGANYTCDGEPIILSTTQPFASYLWSNSSTTQNTSVNSGTFTVSVTNAQGCTGTSAPFSVVVGNTPTAIIGTDPVSPQNPGTTVNFLDNSNGNGSNIVNRFWNLGIEDVTSIQPNPSYTYNDPGVYQITLAVTTAEGCVDTTFIQYVIRPAEVIIPNVFTPNGDANNQYFHIENGQYYDNQLTVYNRWGQAIFEAKNYRNSWSGSGVPDGTYYYVFTLKEGREYTGHVTILR